MVQQSTRNSSELAMVILSALISRSSGSQVLVSAYSIWSSSGQSAAVATARPWCLGRKVAPTLQKLRREESLAERLRKVEGEEVRLK